jgi:hypothetical protein
MSEQLDTTRHSVLQNGARYFTEIRKISRKCGTECCDKRFLLALQHRTDRGQHTVQITVNSSGEQRGCRSAECIGNFNFTMSWEIGDRKQF